MNPKIMLMASAALAALAVPSIAADSYYFRTKPVVEPVRPFSFDGAAGKTPGASVESTIAKVSGYRGRTASVSGGEYQVCSTSSCTDQGASWRSAPTENLPAEFHARVRATAPAFGQAATARLTVGDASAAFEVASRAKDETPATLSFPSVANRELNQPSYSAAIAVVDHDGVTLSVSGGSYQICSTIGCSERDGQPVQTATSGEVASGTLVRLVATPTAFGQPTMVTLTAGNAVGTFTATGRAADTDPDPVTFAATLDATAAQATDSPIIRLTGHDGVAVSAGNAQFRVCMTADCSQSTGWRTASTMAARDAWAQLRATAPAAGTTASPAPTLNYGGRTATWSLSSSAGSGATFAAMGISDTNLSNALTGALGSTANWIQCNNVGTGGTESCVGASETLVVVTQTSTGYTFGGYVRGDFWSSTDCWSYPQGFYFSNAPSMGMNIRNNTSSGIGQIQVCRQAPTRALFVPLYEVHQNSMTSYHPNGSYNGGSITGAAERGATVTGTVKWYKRR